MTANNSSASQKKKAHSSIIIAGCNPSLQKTLEFETFALGGVNRSCACVQSVGGKGQIAARALHSWSNSNPCKGNYECKGYLLQFIGGQNGYWLRDALNNYKSIITQYNVDISPQLTRSSTTLCLLVENKESEIESSKKKLAILAPKSKEERPNKSESGIHGTELIEPSPSISVNDMQLFLSHIRHLIEDKYKEKDTIVFTVCGTIPLIQNKSNDDDDDDPDENLSSQEAFYKEMILTARKTAIAKNLPLVVIADAYKNITNLLSNEKIPMIDILKINVFEGSFLAELPSPDDNDATKRNEDIIAIGKAFCDKFSQYLQYLIMTDGGKPAWCFDLKQKRYWCFVLPKIKVVNPIGCGDTCTSVLSSILSQLRNADEKEAREKLKCSDDTPDVVAGLRWGLAAASAKTLTLTGGDFDEKMVLELFDKIGMSKAMQLY